jgi:tartrate dehydrogenase/decarboxylase/D-malate dehydrogenase
VHGSAPDIAGRGIANPIGTVWAGAMMLEHLGLTDAARRILHAIERLTDEGKMLTPDLGGTATTEQVGKRIIELLDA